MTPYEIVACTQCGEETIRCNPVCNLCQADAGLFRALATPLAAAVLLTACGGGSPGGAESPSPQSNLAPQAKAPSVPVAPQAQPSSSGSSSSAAAPQAKTSSGPAPSAPAPVYTVSTPTALAFDPAKGDLVEAGASGEVNRLEPDGSIVAVRGPVAPDGSAPARGVAPAPDGSIFESSGPVPQQSGIIERISPGGAVSLVLNRNAFGVAVDPAGVLWWAELGDTGPAQGLWHSALDGTAPVQAVAQPDTMDGLREHARGPHALFLGPAGPIWSTGFSAYDRSGSFDCAISAPPINDCGQMSAYVDGLARSADGTLFAADAGTGAVLKITPSGAISIAASGLRTTEVPLSPTALALDGSGTLWVADTAHNQIRSIAQ